MSGVGQKLFDIFYPIGSYYETSDTNFNPNTANSWYGTWVEDTKGQTLVSRNNGTFSTVGANIGEETNNTRSLEKDDGSAAMCYPPSGNWDWQLRPMQFNKNFNIIQPSKVVIRWHRTA